MRYSLLLPLLFTVLSLFAQPDYQQLVRDMVRDPALAGAHLSVSIVDVTDGRQLGAHQASISAIPASVQKLVTTAAALDLLGPDHRFTTRLLITGPVEAGILRGNVIILGGGDPSLGSPYLKDVPGLTATLDRWRQRLRKAGISRIEGRVIGDGSYYGSGNTPAPWPWSDIGNYYGAGVYGLNFHENFYFLDLVQRGRVGATPAIRQTRPAVPALRLNNELRSGPADSGDQAYIYGAPYGYDNYVRGTIPIGSGRFTIKGAIPDPPLFAAQALQQHLKAGGILVSLPAESHRSVGTGRYANGTVIDRYDSPPLVNLIDRTNLRSNNLYAETLLLEMNKSRGAADHELPSTDLLLDWITSSGLSTTGVQLEDGSGLGTRNFFSAQFMTDFLRHQADNSRWRQSIPLAGRTGSMRGFLKNTAATGRLWAKSGSLGAVRCYAGYVDRPDGQQLAFAIMVNNFTLESKELRQRLLTVMLRLAE